VVELCHGAVGGNRCADYLAAANLARPSLDHLFSAFLVGDEGAPRKSLLPKALGLRHPELAERLEAERERLVVANQRRKAMLIVARSEALLDVLAEIVTRSERQKRARSRLDFDDLIERLGALFADPAQADWVRYKLDAGITHVLVDESQDTNPEQWHVVQQLADEFFVGDSAVERPRTLFAVGDEKQSIYSFQGAEPALFVATGRRYRQAALAVDRRFEEVPLHTSFRTLQGVLAAVDLVFAAPTQQQAVLSADRPVAHDTARPEAGGMVTLWPPLQDEEPDVDPENWPLEPQEMVKSAARRLAERLAGEIAGWLRDGRRLGARNVAVRPGDILILVQSRSLLFAELIRALGQRNIPTPGADRLAVTGHIAVLDLLALADVLLTPADNLQLGALLRSPLFDISEDDLMALAAGRSGTLWEAVAASTLPQAREAAARLRRWRGELDFGRPFEFYAEVLYRDGGLRRFHARLGAEVDDVMTEFLDLALAHEQTENPTLQGFVAAMRARDVSIRRELAEAAGGVRVMTVHGAKGLEAPIVILADAASTPGNGQSPPVFVMKDAPGPLFVHAANKGQHVAASMALRDAAGAAEAAEYWRKLYVGMTRAEDELYVTGYLTRRGRIEDTWYAAIEAALDPVARRIEAADGEVLAKIFPADAGAAAALGTPDELTAAPAGGPLHLPALPQPTPVPVVTPSSAYAASPPEQVLLAATESLGTAETARRAGLALHALLQHLPQVAPAERTKIVEKALPVLLPEAPERHAELARKALAILGNPRFAELFGPNSRAEVPFLVEARRGDAPVRLAGRIDRMVVANDRVLVVDYKSDAVPAGSVSEVPATYLTQVGLYAHVASQLFPELGVQAGILWTSLESLMIIPPATLRDAVSAFTMR
jgi:ATP-dependent helicase/nuclease subunit A